MHMSCSSLEALLCTANISLRNCTGAHVYKDFALISRVAA